MNKLNSLLKRFAVNNGFTLIELLIVISLTTILASIASPIYFRYYSVNQLKDDSQQLVQNLRNTREFSLNGLFDSGYGIYFDYSAKPVKYIIFKGNNYSIRDPKFDRTVLLGSTIALSQIFPQNQIYFYRGLGQPNTTGNIVLYNKIDNSRKKIMVNQLGVVDIINL